MDTIVRRENTHPPPRWLSKLKPFETPDSKLAIRQLADTLLPYAALWVVMVGIIRSGISFWFEVPCMVVAGGLLVRTFIIFHDCTHGSFFKSRNANCFWGWVCGVLTFTPFDSWKTQHAIHHSTSGNLDRRGTGDIWTLTVEEYLNAPWKVRCLYQLYRHPLILFVIGPPIKFFILNRIPKNEKGWQSIVFTDLLLLGVFTLASLTIGLKTYLLVQIPVMSIASCIGVWLFYVQHQFDDDYWEGQSNWDFFSAAIEGSSHYKLPPPLPWFTGHIGLHHIHHLKAGIPNYHLQRCYDAVEELQMVPPLTLLASLKCATLRLWNPEEKRMVPF